MTRPKTGAAPAPRPAPAPRSAATPAVPAVAGEVLGIAERLLTRRQGATVTLADPETLVGSGRSVVVRARVAANPFGLPRSLVIKHYPDGAALGRVDRFRREAASCQLFTAMSGASRPSAELIAHDPERRLLVLEDLGRASTLADKLFGSDPVGAEQGLINWAQALGRLHAATAGRERDFGALLRRLGERSWRDPMADDARSALAEVPALVEAQLGVRVSDAAAEDARATSRLLGGTRYRAFSPSDSCPDNNLVTPKGVRFVDFEWGCFRDVMLDAAYTRVPFPACESSFALPSGLAGAMLAAWCAEVVAVWPELDDPVLAATRMLDAQLLWVWFCTRQLLPRALAEDGRTGPDLDRSPRALLALAHYWRRLGLDAAAGGRAATVELADQMVAALGPRLGEQERELPLFPAFRSR